MTAIAPTSAAPTPSNIHVPSVLTAPSVPNASAAAAASLRTASTALARTSNHSDNVTNAAGLAKFARTLLVNDADQNNDAFIGMIDSTVIGALEAAAADPAHSVSNIELAGSAANNIADALQPQLVAVAQR